MPTEHIRFSYTFDELSDEAKQKAVATIAGKLSGDWWDSADNESVAEAISYGFASAVGFATDTGAAHSGIKLDEWSCGYMQSDSVVFVGSLTRDNAPALPWVDGIASVTLDRGESFRGVWFVMDEPECICDPYAAREPDCEAHDQTNQVPESAVTAMREAIESAIGEAHQAGYREVEYKGSEEYAREWIDGNNPDFNKDGSLF